MFRRGAECGLGAPTAMPLVPAVEPGNCIWNRKGRKAHREPPDISRSGEPKSGWVPKILDSHTPWIC